MMRIDCPKCKHKLEDYTNDLRRRSSSVAPLYECSNCGSRWRIHGVYGRDSHFEQGYPHTGHWTGIED